MSPTTVNTTWRSGLSLTETRTGAARTASAKRSRLGDAARGTGADSCSGGGSGGSGGGVSGGGGGGGSAAASAAALEPADRRSWAWHVCAAWRLFDIGATGYLEVGEVEAILTGASDVNLSRGALNLILRRVARPPPDLPAEPPPASGTAAGPRWRVNLADLMHTGAEGEEQGVQG